MATCAGCHRKIQGAYITALGQAWHQRCFVCAGCGRAFAQERFLEQEGRPYHADCYHQRFSPRCAGCGEPITGAYTTALGQQWHPEHFVCAHCRRPFPDQGFLKKNDQPYHEECYHQRFSPRCAVCGQPMRDRYLTNAWDQAYCEHHEEELPTCFSCQRLICTPLTGGGVRYGDGRTMCNLCRPTAIDRAKDGASVLKGIRRSLGRLGIDLAKAPTPLRLVDQPELDRLNTKDHAQEPVGMARTRLWTENGHVVRREVEEILVLHGLPEEHFSTAVAHELGHAWLFLNAYPELPPLVEEGICELFASLWLEQQRTPEAAFRLQLMENNDDPVYGRGYHAARRALKAMSLPALLTHVRQQARFPRVPGPN